MGKRSSRHQATTSISKTADAQIMKVILNNNMLLTSGLITYNKLLNHTKYYYDVGRKKYILIKLYFKNINHKTMCNTFIAGKLLTLGKRCSQAKQTYSIWVNGIWGQFNCGCNSFTSWIVFFCKFSLRYFYVTPIYLCTHKANIPEIMHTIIQLVQLGIPRTSGKLPSQINLH